MSRAICLKSNENKLLLKIRNVFGKVKIKKRVRIQREGIAAFPFLSDRAKVFGLDVEIEEELVRMRPQP